VHVIASRYIIAGVLFFLVWLLLPRKKIGASLSKAGLILVIIGGLLSVYPQLHFPEAPPDLTTVSKINHLIRGLVRQHNLKDINIAALQSGDIEPQAQKYRDLLSMSGITFRAPMEYDASSHLFVISTAGAESIRKGSDHALTVFSNSKQLHVFPIEKTPWKVYWFEK
jgi:disulfide bond formation protein DsbB